jgi:UDP-glucose 4-epimerase
MANIGIVGSSGFLGSALTLNLAIQGHEIIGFSRDSVLTHPDTLKVIRDLDYVVWSASRTNPSLAENQPELVNIEIDEWKEFLQAILDLSPPKLKIIFFSSGGCVYSGEGPIFREVDASDGINLYGSMKSRMEIALMASSIPYTILRVANIYGPNQPTGRGQGVIAEWVARANQNLPLLVYGDLNSARDFLFISDFLEAIQLVLKLEGNHVINLGSGVDTKLETVLRALTTNSQNDLAVTHLNPRKFDRSAYRLDISLAKELLNWSPKINIEKGIRICLGVESLAK